MAQNYKQTPTNQYSSNAFLSVFASMIGYLIIDFAALAAGLIFIIWWSGFLYNSEYDSTYTTFTSINALLQSIPYFIIPLGLLAFSVFTLVRLATAIAQKSSSYKRKNVLAFIATIILPIIALLPLAFFAVLPLA